MSALRLFTRWPFATGTILGGLALVAVGVAASLIDDWRSTRRPAAAPVASPVSVQPQPVVGARRPERQPEPPPPPLPPDPFQVRVREVITRFYTADDPETFGEIEELFEEARTSGQVHRARVEPMLTWLYASLVDITEPSDEAYKERLAKFERWSELHPDSCIPLVAAAGTYRHWAWFARGDGFAYAVDEDAWRPFRLRLVEARDLLDKAEKLTDRDADLYVERISVATGDGTEREQVDKWFEEGRKINPTCWPLYQSMSMYLLPRWHGQPGDIEQFAKKMLEAMPGEDGLTAYAIIAFQHGYFEPYAIMHGDYDRKSLHEAAQVVVKNWPYSTGLNEFAGHVGWIQQDLDLARKAQAGMQGKYSACWWNFGQAKWNFETFCKREKAAPLGDLRLLGFESVEGVRFMDSGKHLVTFTRGATALQVWDVEAESQIAALPIPMIVTQSLDKHPTKDHFVMSGQTDVETSSAFLIDLENLSEPKLLYDTGIGRFHEMRYSPDGETVMSCNEHQILFWDVATQQIKDRIERQNSWRGILFAPDGQRLTTGTGEIWDPKERTWAKQWDATKNKRYNFHSVGGFVGEDTILGSATDSKPHRKVLLTWDVKNDVHEELMEVSSIFHQLRLSPSKRRLAAVGRVSQEDPEEVLLVFDLETRSEIFRVIPGEHPHDLDFSPDESLLAAGGAGVTRIFRLPTTAPATANTDELEPGVVAP